MEHYGLNFVGKKESIEVYNGEINKRFIFLENFSIYNKESENTVIIGDNLDVLKLLLKGYRDKIDFIYIDPPYNTNLYETAYSDVFVHIEKKITKDLVNRNEYNHNGWLYFMYPRLLLARDLMKEDSLIFISIDDRELYNLKLICDEIFGESNFVSNLIRVKSTNARNHTPYIASIHDYILIYAKNKNKVNIGKDTEITINYLYKDEHYETRGGFNLQRLDIPSTRYSEEMDYEVVIEKDELISVLDEERVVKIKSPERIVLRAGDGVKSKRKYMFTWSKEKFYWGLKNDFLVFKKSRGKWFVMKKMYQFVDHNGEKKDISIPFRSVLENFTNEKATIHLRSIMGDKVFIYPKPIELIMHLLKISNKRDGLFLDFFAGSGTTGEAVIRQNLIDGGNRKFILCQIDEKIKEYTEGFLFCKQNNIEPFVSSLMIERLKRSFWKIKEEMSLNLFNNDECLDIGFKIYKLE